MGIVFLAGCQTQKEHPGFLINTETFKKVSAGQTRDNVERILGTPTCHLFNCSYYVSTTKCQRALSRPWLYSNSIHSYTLHWDEKGILRKIVPNFKGREFSFDRETTPLVCKYNVSLIASIFRNTASMPALNVTM